MAEASHTPSDFRKSKKWKESIPAEASHTPSNFRKTKKWKENSPAEASHTPSEFKKTKKWKGLEPRQLEPRQLSPGSARHPTINYSRFSFLSNRNQVMVPKKSTWTMRNAIAPPRAV